MRKAFKKAGVEFLKRGKRIGVTSPPVGHVGRFTDRRSIQDNFAPAAAFAGVTTTDFGTVIDTAWSGVTINWDDGHTSSVRHNDMKQVERVPMKLV
jgi:hypothetical protein